MPRTAAAIGRERSSLLAEKARLDGEIAVLKAEKEAAKQNVATRREYTNPKRWEKLNHQLLSKGRRSQAIQLRLSELKDELQALREGSVLRQIMPPTTPQARTAVLFQVAHASFEYHLGGGDDSDEEEERAHRRVVETLEELEYVVPGWRKHRAALRKAS